MLHLHGCQDSIGRTRESHEEGITLGIHFVTMKAVEDSTQELAPCGNHLGVALPHLLLQARGAFDVGEEEGDSSTREFTHAAPPCVFVGCVTPCSCMLAAVHGRAA